MSDKFLTTPWDVANSFLTRFEEYRNGTLVDPVLTPEMSQGIMNSIRKDPIGMVNFFVQTNYLIKHGLDDKFGKNSEVAILGVLEWSNLTYGMFIPSLSLMMNANQELLAAQHPELIPDEYPMGVPEGDPSEISKNLDFDLGWITPPDPSDDTPPEDPERTEDKPE